MSSVIARPRLTAVQEVFALWAASFAAIVITFLIVPSYAKLVATVGFLYLPMIPMRWRGEDYADYGLRFGNWRADLKWFLLLFAVVTPPFVLVFFGYGELLDRLPTGISDLLSPLGARAPFHFRFPNRFGEWSVDQLLVVAVPEEFFYRGYIQTRLKDAWPGGKNILGVRVGPAFLVTAVLFALGHLAIFEVWRLGVFFPALLFGWLREKTGTTGASSLFHAACNLLELVLEASFYAHP